MHVPVDLYHRLPLVFRCTNLNDRVRHHGPSGESLQVMTMALVGKSATISRIRFAGRNRIEHWTEERAGRGDVGFGRGSQGLS